MRKQSIINPAWWDFTTLDNDIIEKAARLTVDDMKKMSRKGFTIKFYTDLQEMYLTQALEYIKAWKQSKSDCPAGICGPTGPTKQMPLVARLVNELEIDLKHAHFWAMDEWCVDGKALPAEHPLSFQGANRRLWINQLAPHLRIPEENLHFINESNLKTYSEFFDKVRCVIMQGGLGHTLHWAFNDPLPREGKFVNEPPSLNEYKNLPARHVTLHPLSQVQNATGLVGRNLSAIPNEAYTVGGVETWKSEQVSMWHLGNNPNPFAIRLALYMLSNKIIDSSTPTSVLADHPNVVFHLYTPALSTCEPSITA